jgi:hypothetical protein
VVEIVDPGEDAGADADGGLACSQQCGEFAVDVGVVASGGRPRIPATRGYRRLDRLNAAATVHLDETESVVDTTRGHHGHPVARVVAGRRTG